jgi:hypothetical protein
MNDLSRGPFSHLSIVSDKRILFGTALGLQGDGKKMLLAFAVATASRERNTISSFSVRMASRERSTT